MSIETGVAGPPGAVNATLVWTGTAGDAPMPPGSVETFAGPGGTVVVTSPAVTS